MTDTVLIQSFELLMKTVLIPDQLVKHFDLQRGAYDKLSMVTFQSRHFTS